MTCSSHSNTRGRGSENPTNSGRSNTFSTRCSCSTRHSAWSSWRTTCTASTRLNSKRRFLSISPTVIAPQVSGFKRWRERVVLLQVEDRDGLERECLKVRVFGGAGKDSQARELGQPRGEHR